MALILSDRCPYKKRRLGYRHTEGQLCEDTGEDGRPHARERGLRRNQPCPRLDLGPPASGSPASPGKQLGLGHPNMGAGHCHLCPVPALMLPQVSAIPASRHPQASLLVKLIKLYSKFSQSV